MEIFAFLASDHERSCVLNRLNEERPPCKADAGLAINRRNSVVSATEKWPNQPPPHDDSTRAAVVFCVNGPHPAVADPTIDPVRRNVVVEARRKRQEQKTAERKSFFFPPPPLTDPFRSVRASCFNFVREWMNQSISVVFRSFPLAPSLFSMSFLLRGRDDPTQRRWSATCVCVCVCVCIITTATREKKTHKTTSWMANQNGRLEEKKNEEWTRPRRSMEWRRNHLRVAPPEYERTAAPETHRRGK